MRTHELIEDPHFGPVTASCDHGRGVVEVSGPGVPTVSVERSPETTPKPDIPIGTRKAAHLTLRVNGRTLPLRPGRGARLQRTYRVRVRVGTTLRLDPSGTYRSRLLRSHRVPYTPLGFRRRIGEFGTDSAVTDALEALPNSVSWSARSAPTAEEAALGYAMGTAFGVGHLRPGDDEDVDFDSVELASTASSGVFSVIRAIGRGIRRTLSALFN